MVSDTKYMDLESSILDHILVEGDKLYEWLNIQNYPNVEELSKAIVIFSHSVTLEISEENIYKYIVNI